MVVLLEKIRKTLSLLRQATGSLADSEESQTATVNMLVALIEFWVEARKELRLGSECK